MFTLRKPAAGNVLFLILIAVVLFGALSYAITKSVRGTHDITKEKSLVTAGKLSQQGNLVRQTIFRMLISKTATEDEIEFGAIAFGVLLVPCTTGNGCIYASEGGGLTYENPPDGIGAANKWSPFLLSAGYSIDGVGTAAPDSFLAVIGVTDELCRELNRGVGITGIPANSTLITTSFLIDAASGHPFACVRNTDGLNWYYHALIEK